MKRPIYIYVYIYIYIYIYHSVGVNGKCLHFNIISLNIYYVWGGC